MKYLRRVLLALSSLKVAIILLLLIAIACAIGTSLPQGELHETYIAKYQVGKFLGLLDGNMIIRMQLDQVYSSIWFLGLLTWLSISLIICSWRRQWPALKKAIAWIDYKDPRQIQKLAISQTFKIDKPINSIEKLEHYLVNSGWNVKRNSFRISARKGLIGRVGPPLVHFGLIILIFGASYGALEGARIERFLAPDRSLNLLSPNGSNQINLKLTDFRIERGPNGQPEQFRSSLELSDKNLHQIISKQISVNHPLRFKGITIYQADWSLAAITIQIDKQKKLRFPLKKIEALGDQVWGVLIPKLTNKSETMLLTISSENGPVRFYSEEGVPIGTARPQGGSIKSGESEISVIDILPSSGILVKYDPGVPIVYIGFAISLIGSIFSIISTKQLWIIAENNSQLIHIGGLANRNSIGFAKQFPLIVKSASID